ncbi:MAG TPA: hypothetical protein VFD83_04540 [Candidatus Polarisedimenticolia bacterium]|nr:hypothetical protein [Candidatus Polarisedimenticolia bacterium]
MPVELRDRVHMSARQVPGFPDEDPKLAQLKNWPRRRPIEGMSCELRVENSVYDTPTPAPRTGLTVARSAYYLCRRPWWPWGKPQRRGPHYTWTSGGQLLERAYTRSRNDVLIYQTDRSGRLVGFEDQKHGVTEYFDENGVLIAGEYAPIALDWRAEGYRGGTVSVWLGQRVTHVEFVRRRAKLFRDVAWRY